MKNVTDIQAAIFDMDGLLIDSEPLWSQAEREVFSSLGLDVQHVKIPNTLGLRIDCVVALWYQHMPWQGVSHSEVIARITQRTVELIKQNRPLLPGVEYALQICREQGIKIALASASPLFMLHDVLELFDIHSYFDTVVSAESLPYSKPHPQVYLLAAQQLTVDPLHCVTLEDSIFGMIATKAARMRSIVIPAAQYYQDPRWALAEVKRHHLHELTPQDICPVNGKNAMLSTADDS